MRNLIKHRAQSGIVILLITSLVLLTTACPSQDAIRKAAKASNDLAHLTNNVVDAVRTAFQAGVINEAAKNKMADALIVIAREGKAFNDLIIANQALAKNGQFPPNVFAILSTQFDKVVQPFLDLATQLNLLGPSTNHNLATTFAALRGAILIISAAFRQT